jgi:Family of unknown function (DUF5675)
MNLYVRCIQRMTSRTLSGLFVNDDANQRCYVVEDVVREQPDVPVAEWKVYGKTAIPAGRYRVTLEESVRFGHDTLTLNDVPGFTQVRMHSGNDETHTEGCLLLGYEIYPNGTIRFGTTIGAVLDIKSLVRKAIDTGEEVWITISRETELAHGG